jgi:hypothetical protein
VHVRGFIQDDASVDFLVLRVRADWELCGHALHGERGTTAPCGDRLASAATAPVRESFAPQHVVAFVRNSTCAAPYAGASVVLHALNTSQANQLGIETKCKGGRVPANTLVRSFAEIVFAEGVAGVDPDEAVRVHLDPGRDCFAHARQAQVYPLCDSPVHDCAKEHRGEQRDGDRAGARPNVDRVEELVGTTKFARYQGCGVQSAPSSA